MTMQAMRRTFVLLTLLIATPTAALAQANCKNTANFDAWLVAVKKEALAKGISQNALAAASPYMVLEQRILNIDRSQKFFAQDFLEISTKMLPSGRLTGGAAKIKQYRDLFNREEKEFGVPASVITAFWGLESDFGVGHIGAAIRTKGSSRRWLTARGVRSSSLHGPGYSCPPLARPAISPD